MAAALAHRGPDGQGVWIHGPLGLAHRRLAIIDLAGGRQPMVSPHTGATLTFNGEIYNFRDLRTELIGKGVRFDEQSDTEVVLRAYDYWGEDAVHRLHGMFAFAIWDPRRRALFAARDRLGIKPFYYYWNSDTLVFASELKALAARGDVPLAIDEAAFESYLQLQYIAAPSSIFKNVRPLPPGHVLTIDSGGVLREERYWRAKPAPRGSKKDDVEECRYRLAAAVKSHLVADVPVGAFLSGGIDSSLIVAHMAALGPVKTFSIGFEGGDRFDERPAARQVARHLGTCHHERLVTDEDAVAGVSSMVARMDEPLADFAALPTWLVAQSAARDVKVVLTGEGADELFGGYPRYRKELWLAPLASLGRPYQATHLFSESEIAGLLGRAPQSRPPGYDAQDDFDRLNRLLVRDLEGWLADDLLVKIDRMTMLCSLEARVPYLDHTFVEFALGIPGRRKMGWLRGTLKKLLRESAIGLLPEEILNRPKHGFTPPLDAWFRGRLGAFAREVLLDASSPLAARIGPQTVHALLREQTRGRRNGHKIWALLVYDLWSRHYGIA